MKIGDVFEAHVRDMTSEGQAVVSAPNGRSVFVSGLWLGETARVRITALKGRVGFAELEEILLPSASRRSPPCQFHGVSKHHCGGCPWMHVDYNAQLQAKQKRVEHAMARLSEKIEVQAIQPSADHLGYRNRVQFKTDGEKLGFVAAKSNTLVDVDDCLVLSEANRFSLKKLREQLPNAGWRPLKRQKWTTLDIDEATAAANVSVNQRLSFQQANTRQNQYMHQWLMGILSQIKDKRYALELFCGSGNFTEILSRAGFAKIIAVEGQSDAVVELESRKLAGVSAEVRDLFDEKALASLVQNHREARFMLLDPPRDGLKSRAALLSTKSKLREVVYISCDLATFSRDLRDFIEAGFKVKELQPLDQFPQTPHIELLCYMAR